MKHYSINCDFCNKLITTDRDIVYVNMPSTGKGGILLARLEYEFCNTQCLADFLNKYLKKKDK